MKISLTSKMALSVSVLFIFFSSAVTWFTLSLFQKKLEEALVTQQSSLASSLALSIDNKLHMARTAMVGATSKLTPATAADPKQARDYLDSRPTLQSIFDNGIFLFDKDGHFIAQSTYLPPHSREDISRMENLSREMAGDRRVSGANHVVTSSQGGKVAIFMTVPVKDGTGKIYAVLGGGIDPYGKNFLEEISRIGIGGNGFLYICDDNRRIIVHQDRTRLFEPVPEGATQLLEHAEGGFQRSGITTDPRKGEMITSFRHLDSTGWFVAINLPLKEAYAPLYQARRYFIAIALVGTIGIVLLVYLLMRRVTAPLKAITSHMTGLMERPEPERFFSTEGGDEIGTLAEAFNGMIATLGNQQKTLEQTTLSAENEKARAEAVIASIGEALCIVDMDFRVLYQNRLHQAMIDDHRGETCYAAFHNAETVCHDCPVASVFADGRVHEVSKDVAVHGERRKMEIIASPLHDATGELVAAIEIVREVTAAHQKEEQIQRLYIDLQRKAAALELSNREHEAFGYSLSHDLKTPLTRISFAAQTLEDLYGGQLDDSGRFCIDSISKASTRMAEMIDGMLLLSRITRSDLIIEDVDMSMVAEDICHRHTAETSRKVAWSVEPGLSAKGDPRLLKSMMENLLGNAWKYTLKTENPHIAFGAKADKETVTFFVRDNGAGFPSADAERIFQPFLRVHRNDEFDGSGIGLATVQRIVERHGGRIWAEGEPAKGATFFFTLP